jgi:hypothetical protein
MLRITKTGLLTTLHLGGEVKLHFANTNCLVISLEEATLARDFEDAKQLVRQLNLESVEDLEDVNIKIQKWLLGLLDKKYIDDIISGSTYSMFWNRILGNLPKDITFKDPRCHDYISEVVKLFKINSMVIGHTPQSFLFNEKINGTCSNKVWRIDNGSSKAFNVFDHEYMKTGSVTESRKPQVLEILNDEEFNVLM